MVPEISPRQGLVVMQVPFYKPYLPPYDLVEADFRDAYSRGMLAPSVYTDRFTEAVEEYFGVRHAVAFSNCSAGMMCLVGYLKELTGKSSIVVPNFTFAATWQAADWNGMNTILVDVDEQGLIDLNHLEKVLAEHAPDVAAVLAVHMFGRPPDLIVLQEMTMRYKTHLIFDAAHGMGTLVDGKPLGSCGLAEVFSIGATKTLAAGEGGVLTTNDDQLAEAMRRASMHGHKYGGLDVELKSLNGRIQEINSIIGYHGLPLLEDSIRRRQEAAEIYNVAINSYPRKRWYYLRTLSSAANVVPSYKDYTIFVELTTAAGPAGRSTFDVREQIVEHLAVRGVNTKRYYYPDLARLSVIQTGQGLGGAVLNGDACSTGSKLADGCISLPFFTDITREQQEYVLGALGSALNY